MNTVNEDGPARRLSPSDIADLVGATPAAVSNWRKRHKDFPAPVGGARQTRIR